MRHRQDIAARKQLANMAATKKALQVKLDGIEAHLKMIEATKATNEFDFDDTALCGHPSAVLVPAILAQAETSESSGAEMMAAYLAGYEVWADRRHRQRPRCLRGDYRACSTDVTFNRSKKISTWLTSSIGT